ncbi:hypothetical protein SBF1_6550001 [Candidatus Desulfosporosinus infrequens]|uniref:Uncharacterized protein n=1 Tax=Candidatus Desulfosporosinus infrequens TaxID=2043169 RepID=A0A2U3LN10_9FIRM|nr:hypothetical protein SBF1_6550001 [Candidatus Desulfosporosinus infrequens]
MVGDLEKYVEAGMDDYYLVELIDVKKSMLLLRSDFFHCSCTFTTDVHNVILRGDKRKFRMFCRLTILKN